MTFIALDSLRVGSRNSGFRENARDYVIGERGVLPFPYVECGFGALIPFLDTAVHLPCTSHRVWIGMG